MTFCISTRFFHLKRWFPIRFICSIFPLNSNQQLRVKKISCSIWQGMPIVKSTLSVFAVRAMRAPHVLNSTNPFPSLQLLLLMDQSQRLHAASVIVYSRSSVPGLGISQICSSAPSAGFLATYWMPGAIGHSILRPEPDWVAVITGCAVAQSPSLLLLVLADELIENPSFWQTNKCPISTPPPLENDHTPFTKNLRFVAEFSCSTG